MKKTLKAILAAALAAVSLTVGVCAAWAADQAVFSNEPTSTFTTKIYNYPVEQTVYVFPAGTTVSLGEGGIQINFSKMVNNNTEKESLPGEMITLNDGGSFTIPDDGAIYCVHPMDWMGSGMDYYVTVSATPGSSTEEPAEPAAPAFTDVAENAYYAQPVAWAVEQGITAGKTDTTFAPNETCTTAHILTFLWRAMGSPEPTIENPFTDVTESNYYYKAALWASENELVSGNVFTASAPCTRGQTMLFLYLLAGSPAVEPTTFTDVAADSVYNRAISWAVTEGITTGKTADTFDPDGICTRGNIVTFLYRDLAE